MPGKAALLHCLLTLNTLGYICYDDGCHLKRYAMNPCRCDQTPTTKILSELTITVDKMHMAGHVDAWCKKKCDPQLFLDLNKVSYIITKDNIYTS